MEDKKRFIGNLMGLAEILGTELSELKADFYWKTLSPYSDDAVETVIISAARTLKFFPKPVELIELIEGKTGDRALLAWEQLLGAIKSHGSYASVVFGDGKIAQSVELMGGWLQVCAMTEDETKWRFQEFTKIYSGLNGNVAPKKLIGRHEQDNHARGFGDRTQPPILIGDCSRYSPKEIEAPEAMKEIESLANRMDMNQ